MNKNTSRIIKLNNATIESYKRLFVDFKKKGIVVFEHHDWCKPCDYEFNEFGNNATRYIKHQKQVTITSKNAIRDLLINFKNYAFVTVDEIKQFETVIYPKLYAKWKAKMSNLDSKDTKTEFDLSINRAARQTSLFYSEDAARARALAEWDANAKVYRRYCTRENYYDYCNDPRGD